MGTFAQNEKCNICKINVASEKEEKGRPKKHGTVSWRKIYEKDGKRGRTLEIWRQTRRKGKIRT